MTAQRQKSHTPPTTVVLLSIPTSITLVRDYVLVTNIIQASSHIDRRNGALNDR